MMVMKIVRDRGAEGQHKEEELEKKNREEGTSPIVTRNDGFYILRWKNIAYSPYIFHY